MLELKSVLGNAVGGNGRGTMALLLSMTSLCSLGFIVDSLEPVMLGQRKADVQLVYQV